MTSPSSPGNSNTIRSPFSKTSNLVQGPMEPYTKHSVMTEFVQRKFYMTFYAMSIHPDPVNSSSRNSARTQIKSRRIK